VTRHFAIGDIHGCIDSLRSLVDYVAPGSGDTLVTLGDYVDRGPDSRAVLDFVIDYGETNNLVPLRGNHEIMLLDARENKGWFEPWLRYGGDATLLSYGSSAGDAASFDDIPESHIEFLTNQLLPFYECDSHFFVHANAVSDVPLDQQGAPALYWRKFRAQEQHCSDKIMVCGHSAQRSGLPLNLGHSICIDTWAHGGGWLSCLEVESGTIWQANEEGDRRSFKLSEMDNIAAARIDPQS
jgi:serine/threonine protein phosphatase 1